MEARLLWQKFTNACDFATKSVSQVRFIKAALVLSELVWKPQIPSFYVLPSFFSLKIRFFLMSIFLASAMSFFESKSAFLQSLIGADVISLSLFTSSMLTFVKDLLI
jgi:hypothetical protein